MSPLLFLALVLGGCEVDPCPETSILDGEGGLAVTEAEHGIGWGEPDCLGCHTRATLHRGECNDLVDYYALDEWVESEGAAVCADCHGDNGVTP